MFVFLFSTPPSSLRTARVDRPANPSSVYYQSYVTINKYFPCKSLFLSVSPPLCLPPSLSPSHLGFFSSGLLQVGCARQPSNSHFLTVRLSMLMLLCLAQ